MLSAKGSAGEEVSSGTTIYKNTSDLSNLFTRVMSKNEDGSENRMIISNYSYYSFIFKNYNLYVISDAYLILDMLTYIAMYSSKDNISDKLKATKYYSYIATFNPKAYDYKKTGSAMEYLFDNDYASLTNGEYIKQYTYNNFYSFASKALKAIGGALSEEYLSMLPTSSEVEGAEGTNKFMKITRIDVAAAAKSAISVNFLANHFKQTDLVISVLEQKERYKEQEFVRGTVGAIDAIANVGRAIGNFFRWLGNKPQKPPFIRQDAYGIKAYKYYTLAKTKFTTSGTTPMFSFSDGHAGNALSFGAGANENGNPKANKYYDDLDGNNILALLASFYQSSSSRKDNYFATCTGSGCLSPEEFYNGKNNVASLNAIVDISTDEDSRLATKKFDLNPEDYKTKHDRVTEVITAIGTAIGTIGAIVINFTPVGWVSTAVGVIAIVAVSAGALSAIERASSDITKLFNTEVMKGELVNQKAELFGQMFKVKNGVITFNRLSESTIDSSVTLIYAVLQ